MLDLKFIRENPDAVRQDLARRGDEEKRAWVDDLIENDRRSRVLKVQADELRRRRNSIAREINEERKAGRDTGALKKEASELPGRIREIEAELDEITATVRF